SAPSSSTRRRASLASIFGTAAFAAASSSLTDPGMALSPRLATIVSLVRSGCSLQPHARLVLSVQGQQSGHFRTRVSPGERKAQRVEQPLALAARFLLERFGERAPPVLSPRQKARGFGEKGAVLIREIRPCNGAGDDVPPVSRVADFGEIQADRLPTLGGHPIGQAVLYLIKSKLMDDR